MATAANSPHEGTLEVIRRITDDGILCEREVWDLAEYLNGNREARNAWPGVRLFPLLHQVFEDGVLSNEEMTQMAAELSELEHRCATDAIPRVAEVAEVRLDAIKIEDCKLPKMAKLARIPCQPSGEVYRVDLRTHSCSCPAWFGNRRKYPVGSLNRACVHVIDAYRRELSENPAPRIPSVIHRLVEDLSFRGRGVDHDADWKLLKVEMIPHLVSIGQREWNTVYAPSGGARFDRYAFNRSEGRWAYGATPPRHRHVEKYIRNSD